MPSGVKILKMPLTDPVVSELRVGDQVLISGRIFCGRDAVLPRICQLYREGRLADYGIDLEGSLIFHSAVSPAGLGPTSSNKEAIEACIPLLSEAGVKFHLGKGALGAKTVALLDRHRSVFGIVPPVTALLGQRVLSKRVLAYPELGMEAFYELEVEDFPAMIGAAHKKSIYGRT